jgi:hypothetical protein
MDSFESFSASYYIWFRSRAVMHERATALLNPPRVLGLRTHLSTPYGVHSHEYHPGPTMTPSRTHER